MTSLAELPVFCSAHTSAGNPCRRRPIKGSNVCASHGGRAPQVKRKAQQRIDEAADSAAGHLIAWMNSAKVPYNIRLQAARDLLDRANVGTDKTLTVELKAYEQNIEGLLVDVEEGDFQPDTVRGMVLRSTPEPPMLPITHTARQPGRDDSSGPRQPRYEPQGDRR